MTAKENLAERVVLHQGSATEIPLDDLSVDVVVSGLVLNFILDPLAALSEMARVTENGGTIAAYVWDYAGEMELLRIFWDTAAELSPEAARLHEGFRFPLCHPQHSWNYSPTPACVTPRWRQSTRRRRSQASMTYGSHFWVDRALHPHTSWRLIPLRERTCETVFKSASRRKQTGRSA
jgi:SAM-dependent methyltransferase